MKNKDHILSVTLAAMLGAVLLAVVLMRTFLPQYIVPKVSIPNLVLVSLAALVIEHYIARGAQRCYICIPLFALISFALLPWAAGYAAGMELLRLAVGGAAVFTATTWLYGSICDRLSSGPAAKAAPVVSAIGLYFAAQCLTGIIF